jgi:hypothetical protein
VFEGSGRREVLRDVLGRDVSRGLESSFLNINNPKDHVPNRRSLA